MTLLGNIRSGLESLYAAQYVDSLKRWHGDTETASFTTATALAGAVFANFFLTYAVIAIVFPQAKVVLPKWLYLLPPIVILALAHMYFVRNQRYEKLAADFRRRPSAVQRRAHIISWIYLAVSYVTPIVFFFAMDALK